MQKEQLGEEVNEKDENDVEHLQEEMRRGKEKLHPRKAEKYFDFTKYLPLRMRGEDKKGREK